MAKSKDDIKYATAQAQLTEDDAVRVAYVAGTPLEAGKISDSQPVDLFSAAHNIDKAQAHGVADQGLAQPQMNRDDIKTNQDGSGVDSTDVNSRRFPKKNVLLSPHAS